LHKELGENLYFLYKEQKMAGQKAEKSCPEGKFHILINYLIPKVYPKGQKRHSDQ
jgi:hypothetical protein